MNASIERKVRRLMIVGALAFAVGAPTIACMGGGDEAADGGDEAGDGDEGEDGEDAEFDAAKAIQGTWGIVPPKEDLRQLKIISEALKPKGTKEKLEKTLKPPPSPDELKLFDEARKLDPKSPDAQFLKAMIKMMRQASVEINDSTYTLTVAEEVTEMPYTIDEKGDGSAKVTLTNGPGGTEKHTLTFKGDSKIMVEITSPRPQKLTFTRKN